MNALQARCWGELKDRLREPEPHLGEVLDPKICEWCGNSFFRPRTSKQKECPRCVAAPPAKHNLAGPPPPVRRREHGVGILRWTSEQSILKAYK